MKFFIQLFKNYIYRPFSKFNYNIFFLKLNLSALFKTIIYPHFFFYKNILKIKVLSFTLNWGIIKVVLLINLLSISLFFLFFFI